MVALLSRPTPKTVALLALAWLSLCAVFFLAPELDVAATRAFFAERACAAGEKAPCGGFALSGIDLLAGLRSAFHVLPSIVVAIVAVAALRDVLGKRAANPDARRLRLALIAAFALGPGLLVNVMLKDYWGRPRPVGVDLFGGQATFVRAGEYSTQCVNNCSFVSGEAAGAFMLPLVALLAPRKWRRPLFAGLTATALAVALLRVAFGAHWLSDVLLGGLSTWVVFAAVAVGLGRLAEKRTAQ